jgi:flagellar biosynthesis/type III secretory pathway protein FliH
MRNYSGSFLAKKSMPSRNGTLARSTRLICWLAAKAREAQEDDEAQRRRQEGVRQEGYAKGFEQGRPRPG